MICNPKISETVSLSKILNAFFLHEFAEPDVIIEFLKMHENQVESIVSESFCQYRLFQLDFTYALSDKNKHWWFNCLNKLFNNDCKFKTMKIYLAWQILFAANNHSKYATLKICANSFIQKHVQLNDRMRIKHPHSSRISLKELDLLYIKNITENYYDDAFKGLYSSYNSHSKNIIVSLFVCRLPQFDMFSLLQDNVEKWKYIHDTIFDLLDFNITSYNEMINPCVCCFYKQILEYENDSKIVEHILHILLERSSVALFTDVFGKNGLIDLINEASSAEELILQMDLEGHELTSNELLYLMNTKRRWFKTLKNICEDDFNNILKIPKF